MHTSHSFARRFALRGLLLGLPVLVLLGSATPSRAEGCAGGQASGADEAGAAGDAGSDAGSDAAGAGAGGGGGCAGDEGGATGGGPPGAALPMQPPEESAGPCGSCDPASGNDASFAAATALAAMALRKRRGSRV